MEPLLPGDPSHIGPYRLEARLGTGGMGTVHLGVTPGGAHVAIKVVHPEQAASPQYRRRFAREVEAARRVGGFHTAQVVGADPGAERPWMATAYVPGPSLREVVKRHGVMPPDAVRALGAGLAEGLSAIHACGLVHRDLKPANVIMSADGPRIIDFGIARLIEATAMTTAGTVVGTYTYMSPEQVRAHPVSPASDVFSLGGVLAFAAAGRSPFQAEAVHAVVERILRDPPDLDGLDGELRELVTACLDKDPARRPTVADILARLGTGRRPRRRAVLVGAIAATAAVAAGVPAAILLPGAISPARGAQPSARPSAPRGTPTSISLPTDAAEMFAVAFTAGGATLVGAGFDGIWRWNTATAAETSTTANGQIENGAIALSADGRTLAGQGFLSSSVGVWDTLSGQRTTTLPWAAGSQSMALTADGKTLAVSSGDPQPKLVLWNRTTGGNSSLPATEAMTTMAFSADGTALALGGLFGVTVLDVRTKKTRFNAEFLGVSALIFSPDGSHLAVAEDGYFTVHVLDAVSGQARATLSGHTDKPTALAFSPDGGTLLSGAADKTIRVWDTATWRYTAVVTGDSKGIDSLAFHPSGRSFASGGTSGATMLWTWPATAS
jgi:DNA-binding beta-propeller fold protein YncE